MLKVCNTYLSYTLWGSALLMMAGCSAEEVAETALSGDARELQGIRAVIVGGESATRAGAVTALADYVGRRDFKSGDQAVFTEIRRTETPLNEFTYPGMADYQGIVFQAGAEGGWVRASDDGPERIYWTDAISDHTFISYSIPQTSAYDWKQYKFTQDDTKKTYYIGSIGNAAYTTGDDAIIDYSLTEEEQEDNRVDIKDANDKVISSIYYNPKLEAEDLLIAYDQHMKAEPGGSVALVRYYHALSSIRVVVNISGFSSTASDHAAVVSNMRLLHQPTMYIWMQADAGAQALRAAREGATVTDQAMVNAAWENDGSNLPAFDQRKDMKLWIPLPNGSGTERSKTFTFYGITTPQPFAYIRTLDENDEGRKVELSFDVTYPDPMKPSVSVTRTYTATLQDDPVTADVNEGVFFEPGYNTTINISLNHRNEQMTVGAEYENWQFVATPDQGQLKKNSTFMQDTERTSVTIVGDDLATADDATWLYESTEEDKIYDIYGHDGSVDSPYQISTAYQLLSFAYEVANGRDFLNKYVRLDADITLQQTSDLTKEEIPNTDDNQSLIDNAKYALDWMGIGDAENPFNGTFLGGQRFIHRLNGKPLFAALGNKAVVRDLTMNAISVAGNGLVADSNEGILIGCYIDGNVTLNGDMAGALVGTNSGTVYACHHIGNTTGTAEDAVVGGLVGSNSGTIVGCYNAGIVDGTTTGGIAGSGTGTYVSNYFDKDLLEEPAFTPDSGVTGKPTNEMTKDAFVTTLNTGITTWLSTHTTFESYEYIYQAASYPSCQKKDSDQALP